MKRKILLMLFALPFAGVGVWMGWSTAGDLNDARQMRGWVPVEASLTQAGVQTHRGDDSDTYEAYATYNYDYAGRRYSNDRVGISSGGDNIGDHQATLGAMLGDALRRGDSVTVFVNPASPAESVIVRDLRWGLVGFKAMFVLVFGGIGGGLLIYLLRKPATSDTPAARFADQPWLADDRWQSPQVRSGSRTAMLFTWGFATLWNLISAPLPFVIYQEFFEKDNKLALIGLLFPLVGFGLLVWALRRTLEWRRFGPAPVTLDPFPGAIGGHVGGTIDIDLPFDGRAKFELTLTSVYSYVSGSGDSRSRRESAKWQDSQVGHSTASASGTRLSFRFDVPPGLSESDAAPESQDYNLWRLNLRADLSGTDIDRDYEIPVFATGKQSRSLSELSLGQAKSGQARLDEAAVREIANFSFDSLGRTMYYPMGRNLQSGIVGVMFGLFFGGAGWLLFAEAGSVFMGSMFGLVGGLILVTSIYLLFNSLEVSLHDGRLRSLRRVLGIPVKERLLSRPDFVRFRKSSKMQSRSGNKHVMHYSVQAVGRSGEQITVGEGFRSASRAEAAMRLIAREFGLAPTAASDADSAGFGGGNLLS